VPADKLLHKLAVPPGRGKTGPLSVLAVTPDGKTVLAGTREGVIRRWDRDSGRELPPLGRHYWWVTGLLFPPDGCTLVSVSFDGVLRRWDLESGKERAGADGLDGNCHAVLSPDGRREALARLR
jgi:WD40 repeat protein